MIRRSGTTLVEVLVTIFVMAIGLIALLTLFPIGALRMAEAVKDSRSALAAANAEALAIARNLRNDVMIVPANGSYNYFKNPRVISVSQQHTEDAHQDGASYPVYMDPIGYRTYSGSPIDYTNWVGGQLPNYIRRVNPNYIGIGGGAAARIATLQSFSLLDDITFGANGVPIRADNGQPTTGAGQVQREGRYSWGLMFKRPKLATPSVVDMTVVVYSGRPMQLASGSAVPFGETVYDVPRTARDGNEGETTVTIMPPPGLGRPNVKKGTWILDASRETNATFLKRYGPVHGYFYRVVNYTELANGQTQLQLERPLKATITSTSPLDGRTAKVIVMDNVVEVFEKGPGWLP